MSVIRPFPFCRMGGAGALLTVTLALTACNTLQRLDPTRPLYADVEGAYIDQVERRDWSPIRAEGDRADFYLPSGEVLARRTTRGLVKTAAITSYLNGILRRLLAHSPRQGVQARVMISGESGYGLAHAMPDGVIVVPLGFVESAETEDEIAWLLAHEVSHVILEHHDSDWVERYQDRLVGMTRQALRMASVISKQAARMGAHDNQMLEQVAQAYAASKTLLDVTSGGILPYWNRGQEDEADLLGTDLAMRAGYDWEQGVYVLKKVGAWEQAAQEARERQEQAYRRDMEQRMAAITRDFDFRSLFETFKDGLDHAVSGLRTDLARHHRETEQRMADLAEYSEREYGELELVEPSTRALSRLRARAGVNRLLAHYRRTWTAEQALLEGDHQRALVQIRGGISGGSNRDSLPRLVFADLRNRQGLSKKAMQNLSIAMNGFRPSFPVYQQYARMLYGRGQVHRARQLVERAWQEFQRPPDLMPLRIRLAKKEGDEQRAQALMTDCRIRSSGIAEACEEAYVQ